MPRGGGDDTPASPTSDVPVTARMKGTSRRAKSRTRSAAKTRGTRTVRPSSGKPWSPSSKLYGDLTIPIQDMD
jgi:hypothetical protein